jgi:hypothetical protein
VVALAVAQFPRVRAVDLNQGFRELWYALEDYHGPTVFRDLLKPWIDRHESVRQFLAGLAHRPGNPIPAATDEELWELYALNRVNDTLLLGFQPLRVGSNQHRSPALSASEYLEFFELLGLTVCSPAWFSPFSHEIVEVEQCADDDEPTTRVATLWPCLMLGDLIFSRAGVRVSGGSNHICKDVAEKSKQYWTFRRRNRPHDDLSMGWGSNSQWRTHFRRDYCLRGTLYYNVDAIHGIGGCRDLSLPASLADDEDLLSTSERIELLTNRCFIYTSSPSHDLWPYQDTYHCEE